jgi:hypothetical protein
MAQQLPLQPTGFTVNKSPYTNNDLTDIFAPKNNFDYGTYQLYYYSIGNFDLNNYKGFVNNGAQAFTKTTSNNIVTLGFNTQSYLQFESSGIYELKLSFKSTVTPTTDGAGGYSYTVNIRLNDSSNTGKDDIPSNFNVDKFINVSFNGNCSNDNDYQSQSDNNMIWTYRNSSQDGYLIFVPSIYSTSVGQAYFNLYTLSIIFKLDEYTSSTNPFKIYPQITNLNFPSQNAFGDYLYKYSGNWMVTKLVDINIIIGSFIGDGKSYAEGVAFNNLAASSDNQFTIELFFYMDEDTIYENIISLGEQVSNNPIIVITSIAVDNDSYANKIGLIGYNTTNGIYSSQHIQQKIWYHIAFTRDGLGNYNVYLNGIRGNSIQGNLDDINLNTNIVTVGSLYQKDYEGFRGNISNVRLTQKAVYTDNFTVPSLPLQTTQSASTNIESIEPGECVYLLQCSNTYPFKDTVTGVDITNNGLQFSDASPP